MSLEAAAAAGKLTIPHEPGFVSMVQGLRDWCLGRPPAWIPQTEHLVFLLIDGLGDFLLSALGQDSFLRAHRVSSLHAVFPSTTTVALASLATAASPSQHGMPGWWTYLPARDLATVPLPFCQRFGQRPLALDPREMWPLQPWLETVPVEVLAVSPLDYWDSHFSRYLRGFRQGIGYAQVEECAVVVRAHQQRHRRTYSYVYWPEFDLACHNHGCAGRATREVLARLDRAAADLAHTLGERSRVIVSADHGLKDIPDHGKLVLVGGDPLLDCLRTPPSGEPRTPVFHLKPSRQQKFVTLFEERFQDQFLLQTPEQLQSVLGGTLSTSARERYGDLVGVPLADVALHYRERPGRSRPTFIGYHGGLAPEEMTVPLIVLP